MFFSAVDARTFLSCLDGFLRNMLHGVCISLQKSNVDFIHIYSRCTHPKVINTFFDSVAKYSNEGKILNNIYRICKLQLDVCMEVSGSEKNFSMAKTVSSTVITLPFFSVPTICNALPVPSGYS